jgi:hypothetical protein
MFGSESVLSSKKKFIEKQNILSEESEQGCGCLS